MTLKLGRKPARHTLKTMQRALALAPHLNALGTPPAQSNDYVSAVTAAVQDGNWTMMGNDAWGDCTFADSGHGIMLRTANAGLKIVIPTEQNVLDAYCACTGCNLNDPSTDQGADETTVCEFMETTGLLGHKSVGTGMVDPMNFDHVKWCTQLFGSCRLGINLPQSAMDAFNKGETWDVGGDTTIVGGHDVPIVGYQGDTFLIVTWGTVVMVTLAFLKAYLEEAHAEIYPDWIQRSGVAPNNLDLNSLIADISAVG